MRNSLLTKAEIQAGLTLKDLNKTEIQRRRNLRARVKRFFSGLNEFNKLSEAEKDKRMAICRF